MNPVFVVGAPRSGTTLLTAMLASHSALAAGPETGFFDQIHVATVQKRKVLRSWPENAVAFLASCTRGDGLLVDRYGLTREEIHEYLAGKSPSLAAILEALTDQYCQRLGKDRWIEKTPRHLAYLPVIRRLFPDAIIIRVVRDPRDVALSLVKAQFGPRTILEALLHWKDLDDSSREFLGRDRRIATVYYESLVVDPRTALEGLCETLGVDFEEEMLDPSRSYEHVVRSNETWKANVAGPVDASRVRVWEREMSREDAERAESLLGNRLREHRYADGCVSGEYVEICGLSEQTARHFPQTLERLMDDGFRFWPQHKGERPRRVVLCGAPDRGCFLGHTRGERLRRLAGVTASLVRSWLAGTPVDWVSPASLKADRPEAGVSARWLRNVLRVVDARQIA